MKVALELFHLAHSKPDLFFSQDYSEVAKSAISHCAFDYG